ncbi:caspase-3 isoform X2 [Perca flavescens]|uniref:caspase-3 isoform X2 n=1 Tax=Perca flavescens TaxID=8167 RepID=UPI00106EA0D6|nr:caspase-3-like isoform X2 [Perca flavescens]
MRHEDPLGEFRVLFVRFNMPAKDTVRRNKTAIQATLCGDHRLILNKVHEKNLITMREYNNLKSINKEDVEGHVVELVDKIMNKDEDTCKAFLDLLQTDEDIKTTYPELKNIKLNESCLLITPTPVQECASVDSDVLPQESKRRKEDKPYELNSLPTGLCVIINNENFQAEARNGTSKDAQSLAVVFSWLGFRVLMCKDQTKDQMDRALKCFASQSNLAQLQEFNVMEWSGSTFADLQEAPKHGDAFICCILSHGRNGEVLGIDKKPLSIKQITRTFKATNQSTLTGKPKVFLIQACQGGQKQHGVLEAGLQTDDDPHSPFIPEEADVLVAIATVEDHQAFRHTTDGSWFIQSVCQQLKEGCPRNEDINTILHRVNNEVAQKEGCRKQPGAIKQMSEFRSTLRKSLVLSPHHK